MAKHWTPLECLSDMINQESGNKGILTGVPVNVFSFHYRMQWRIQTFRWGGGGGGLPKKFFQPFGPHFGLKIKRGPGPLRPLPWIYHWDVILSKYSGFPLTSNTNISKFQLDQEDKEPLRAIPIFLSKLLFVHSFIYSFYTVSQSLIFVPLVLFYCITFCGH